MKNDPFKRLLTDYKKSTLFLSAAPGNSGDILLQKGLELYLNNNNFLLTDDIESADVIITHGGSNINDVWKEGIALFTSNLKKYPNKTFIVAPHTFIFKETDFKSTLQEYSQDIHLFAREEYSFARLNSLELNHNVSIYLSDDTAFLLTDTKYIDDLVAGCSNDYVLYAMRTDRESVLLNLDLDRIPQNILERIKLALINYKLRKFIAQSPRTEKVKQKIVLQDISYLPYNDFLKKIQTATEVHTDRLHVGILGAMLGKQVFLYATKHKKVAGVYRKSLQNYVNVRAVFD